MSSKLQKLISEIEAKRKEIDKLRPLPKEKEKLWQEKLKIEWTYNSNALEGNSLTLKETNFFIQHGLTSEGKPLKDFLETKNHVEALEFLENIIYKKRDLSESFIKELNALLLKNITSIKRKNKTGQIFKHQISPGEYKKQDNYVLTLSGKIHKYTEPLQVPAEMNNLIKWYQKEKKKMNSIELAAELHWRLVNIHPFDDGNGRTARITMNLVLMRNHYLPVIIPVKKRKTYLECLEKCDQGNYLDFKIFIAKLEIDILKKMLKIFQQSII